MANPSFSVPPRPSQMSVAPADASRPNAPSVRWLWLALLAHFVVGGIYLAILPLWGGVPDEPLHYSRIKYTAEIGPLPLITDPRNFGETLPVYHFTADPVGTAQHGPLYYWSATPLFWLTRSLSVETQLYVLRGWSLFLGALMLPLCWAILRRLLPHDPSLVVGGLWLVTLLPHRLLMSSVVYNDIGAATATFFYLWLLLRAASDEGDERAWLYAGLGLGLALLTKRVALVTLPATLILLYLQMVRLGWRWPRALRCGGAWLLAVLLVSGWLTARDFWLYGTPLPTEPSIANRSWLELWYAVPPEQFAWMMGYTLRGLWFSIWSQVSWIPFDAGALWQWINWGLYGGLALLTLLTIAGFIGGYRSRWRGLPLQTRDALISFVFMALGMAYGALDWVMLHSFHNNEETGKHAQVIAVCLAGLLAVAWRWLLGPRRAVWGMVGSVVLLALFNVASLIWLTTVLIPKYRPATPALASERVTDLPSGVAPGIWHRYSVPGAVQRGGTVAKPTELSRSNTP